MIAQQSIESLLEQCKASRQTNPDLTIQTGERAILEIESMQKDTGTMSPLLGRFHYYVGNAYFYKRNLKASLRCFQAALGQAEKHQDRLLIADAKIGVGDVARAWGNYISSIELLEQAMEIQRDLQAPTLAFTLHKLGICNHDLSKPKEARKYLILATKHCTEYPNLRVHILTSLAMVSMELEMDPKQIKGFLDEALALSRSMQDKLGEANATCEMGQLYGKIGKLKEAVQLCDASEKMFIAAGFKNYTAASNLYKGQIYCNPKFRSKSIIEAETAFQKSLLISTEHGPKDWVAKSHDHLANFYAAIGREKQAFFHLKECHRLRCEIQETEAESRLEYLSVLHELEEEKQKQELEREKNVILEKANRELERLLVERKQLMGVAAHDLKNPLSGIIGLIDFLKEHPEIQAIEEMPAITELLDLSATNALNIVTNILEDHRLEEGRVKLSIRKTNLNKLCTDICKLFQQKSTAKGIRLDFQVPTTATYAKFDRFSMQQVLDNLVSNAVKFCSAGDEILLSLQPAPESNTCLIHVADTGPGISEKDQAKLFRRFAKLSNNPTANEASSGLGLSIAKKLVELNNGELRFSSNPDGGTTFTVEVPTA